MRARKTHAFLALVFALGLVRAGPLFAQAAKAGAAKPPEQIDFSADSMAVSERGTEVEGQGNVEIKRQEMTLHADQVRLNRETQEMQATGNVTVDDPEWKIKQADRVQFNLGEETGTIENGEMFLENGHLTMGGSRLQKLSGQSYHIDEGFFTTCLCEDGPPTWKISAKEMDVTREGTGKIRGGVFYIMDVPVFYLPYAIFPVKTDRQTGFLFPEVGSTSRSGARYMQPFYWAISKSSDATLTVGVETRARYGFLGEYRTMFSKDFDAQANISYFNESLRHKSNSAIGDHDIAGCWPGTNDCHVIPLNRWSAVADHRQIDPSGWTTYSDVAVFSDDFFVRELTRLMHFDADQERNLKTSRYSQSRAGFYRDWGDTTLRGEWNYYQDFIQFDQNTLQRAPQVALSGRRFLWSTPLELRWNVAGVNYLSRQAPDGLRFDFRPELVLPFNFANYLNGSVSVAPRETVYHLYDTNQTAFEASCVPAPSCTKIPRSYARNNSRTLVEVASNVGTSFGRVFSLSGAGLQKIKHVIEPEVSYLFVSRTKQNDIPIMDGVDRVNHRNVATFSLTNRFWGKFSQLTPAPPEDPDVEMVSTSEDTRELGRLKLAISYSMEPSKGAAGRLSDVDASVKTLPMDYLALGGGVSIDPGSGSLSQASVLFSIFDPRPITRRVLDRDFMRPNSLDFSYRFIGNNRNAPLAQNANLFLRDQSVAKSCPSIPDTMGSGRETYDPRCIGSHDQVLGLVSIHSLFHVTDHVLFMYDANYNVLRSRFSTNRGAIKLLSKCECWSVTFALNHSTNPNETGFKFNFDLLGLSSQSKPSFR